MQRRLLGCRDRLSPLAYGCMRVSREFFLRRASDHVLPGR